jgi:hypothetical protein
MIYVFLAIAMVAFYYYFVIKGSDKSGSDFDM